MLVIYYKKRKEKKGTISALLFQSLPTREHLEFKTIQLKFQIQNHVNPLLLVSIELYDYKNTS